MPKVGKRFTSNHSTHVNVEGIVLILAVVALVCLPLWLKPSGKKHD